MENADPTVFISQAYQLVLEYHQNEQIAQAEEVCREILQVAPSHAGALHYLGIIAYRAGRYAQAMDLLNAAINNDPLNHVHYQNIGPVYRALNLYDEALAAYRKAISLVPDDADVHNNLGNLYRQIGNFSEAIICFDKARRLNPDNPVFEYNLGGVLCEQGRLDDAVQCFQKALHLRPDYADAHNDLGKVYRLQGRLDEAATCYQRAINFNPRHSLAHNNLAGIFKVHGQTAQAVDHYRKALEINPDFADAFSNMLFALQYADFFTSSELFAEHLRYADQFEAPLKKHWQAHANLRDPEKRLNVGYVSADFNHHAVAYFIEPVLKHHDKTRIALFCYYNGTRSDSFTGRIKAAADHWIACKAMSDEQLAQRIRNDQIDILIDLSGHTAGNRLLVFARKPAPIQITWLGYFSTSGLCAMDYRFTDQYMDPPGFADTIHTEELLRLPNFSPFQPAEHSPDINPLPALVTGKITFASLNNLAKLNRRVVRLWARILQALPNAVLMLCNLGDGETKRLLLELFAQEGIDSDRLLLQPWLPILDYLELHHSIDLALDPFPYNGGTITNHSLWMGVPVVTLEGDRPVSRIGASLMARAGLPQFITHSEDEYLACVLNFANNLPELNRIRLGLRERIAGNLSASAEQLTRSVEQVYRNIWHKWCDEDSSVSLQAGLNHHKAGRLAKAETIYRRILLRQPNNADALHFLGVLVHQTGHLDMAEHLIGQAIKIAGSWSMFCSLAAVQQALGNLDAAVASYRAALVINPENTDAHIKLAEILKQLDEFDAALNHAQQAVNLQPNTAETHSTLGNILKARGELAAAIACYDSALVLQPGYASIHLNRGNVLFAQGRYDEALESYRNAISFQPDYADAHNGVGVVMQVQENYEAALVSFEKALESNPDLAHVHSNLGNILEKQGKLDLSIEHCRRALALKPNFAEAYLNLGNALQAQGRLDVAVESYQQALALKPDFVEAYSNLGSALQLQGRLVEAQASYRQALAIDPQFARVYSNLLFALSFSSDCTPAQYLAEARRFDEMVTARARPFSYWPALDRSPAPLRVGMVSGDLKNHPVGYFIEGLLAHIDPARLVLFAYTTNSSEDELTARIKPFFVAWQSLSGLSDQDAARKIHDDGIHVLIDLAGHTAQNRLPLFAWRPAPLQLSWLGYWASTGMSSIDYFLADPLSILPRQRADFSEAVWYLPDTRLCFTRPTEASEPSELPALRNGYVTFGCFQNLFKINDEVLALWARVLRALPTAKLKLQNKQMNSQSELLSLRQRLEAHGIGKDRVSISGPTGRAAYFSAYNEIDIMLDTFPYSGGTTTCEALWMGVPTLTLSGDTLLARQGMSLLYCARLIDWVANDSEAYVHLALFHANNLSRLAQLRSGLRASVQGSPLLDAARFTWHFEIALYSMWHDRIKLR